MNAPEIKKEVEEYRKLRAANTVRLQWHWNCITQLEAEQERIDEILGSGWLNG